MQGMVAAPAVLTLHSGSAFAMASNARCVDNQVDNPVYPSYQSGAMPSDTYVRVQLWSLKPDALSTEARFYVRGDDVEALTNGSNKIDNLFLRIGEWKQFDPANPATDYAKIAAVPTWDPSAGIAGVLAQNGGWVAVRVLGTNNGADIIGIVGPTAYGSAISGSCWASVAVASGSSGRRRRR